MNMFGKKISEHDQIHIQSIVVARGDCAEKDPLVEELRTKIHTDYDGVVLRDQVIPNPPVRGPNGYANITLKEGAVPQRQKPFRQHGEKHDALVKISQGWLDNEFAEKSHEPLNEWLSQAFAVPKKSAAFPWRVVVDMRGPNSQTRACNYPLPCIEDILVKQGRNLIFFGVGLATSVSPTTDGSEVPSHNQHLHPPGHFAMEGECDGTEKCIRPISKDDGRCFG